MVVAPKTGDVVKVQEIYEEPTAIRRVLPDHVGSPGPVPTWRLQRSVLLSALGIGLMTLPADRRPLPAAHRAGRRSVTSRSNSGDFAALLALVAGIPTASTGRGSSAGGIRAPTDVPEPHPDLEEAIHGDVVPSEAVAMVGHRPRGELCRTRACRDRPRVARRPIERPTAPVAPAPVAVDAPAVSHCSGSPGRCSASDPGTSYLDSPPTCLLPLVNASRLEVAPPVGGRSGVAGPSDSDADAAPAPSSTGSDSDAGSDVRLRAPAPTPSPTPVRTLTPDAPAAVETEAVVSTPPLEEESPPVLQNSVPEHQIPEHQIPERRVPEHRVPDTSPPSVAALAPPPLPAAVMRTEATLSADAPAPTPCAAGRPRTDRVGCRPVARAGRRPARSDAGAPAGRPGRHTGRSLGREPDRAPHPPCRRAGHRPAALGGPGRPPLSAGRRRATAGHVAVGPDGGGATGRRQAVALGRPASDRRTSTRRGLRGRPPCPTLVRTVRPAAGRLDLFL